MAKAGPSRELRARPKTQRSDHSVPWSHLTSADSDINLQMLGGDDLYPQDQDDDDSDSLDEYGDSEQESDDQEYAGTAKKAPTRSKAGAAAKRSRAKQRRSISDSDSGGESDEEDAAETGLIDPTLLGDVAQAGIEATDGQVEIESESFNRLVDSLQDTSRQTGALRRTWDTSIEEENQQFEAELRAAAGFKKRKNVRRVSREQNLSPQVKGLISEANLYFVERQLDLAILKLEEVIRIEPTVISAWRTLGLIYEELGQEEKSIQCRIVGAHLQPGANDEWKRLAERSSRMQLYRQAIYCYQQAIRIDKTDITSIWDRALLLRDLNDVKPAINGMLDILKLQPNDLSVVRELIPMLVSIKDYDRGIGILQVWRQHCIGAFPDPNVLTADPDAPQNTFGISELVTLADLLLLVRRPTEAITILRQTARWLDRRLNETFWDTLPDDREFDEDRDDELSRSREQGGHGRMVEMAPPHPIDAEIRLRLGKARMMIKDEMEAKRHFEVLTDADPAEATLIFGEIGDCFYENKMWGEALDVFTDLATVEWIEDVSLYAKLAACNHALGELREAARLYEPVVEASPDNLEWRMGLAEVYEELGEKDRSLQVLRGVVRVLQAQKENRASARDDNDNDVEMAAEEVGDTQMSFFDEFSTQAKDRPTGKRARMSYNREQRLKVESQREQDTILCWKRLELLQSRVFVEGFWRTDIPLTRSSEHRSGGLYGSRETLEDRETRYRHTAQWLEEASSLIESFRSTPRLNPTKRKRGVKYYQSRPSGLASGGRRNISSQARGLLQRLQDQMMEDDLDADHAEIPGMDGALHGQLDHNKFRGISIDSWIDLFAKYAFVLTKGEDDQDLVNEVMQSLFSSNVVWGNFRRMMTVQLSWLSCAMYARDFETIFSCLRWLCQEHQFHNEPLRLLASVINATGFHSLGRMVSNKDAKFYQRKLRYTEAVANGLPCHYTSVKHRYIVPTALLNASKMSKAAASSGEEEEDAGPADTAGPDEETRIRLAKPTKPSPIAEMMYAYMMLCSGGYQASAAFFARAFSVHQSDPLLCLCAAVAFVGRSTNRQTDNRHHMVLEALSFLDLYKRNSSSDKQQEVEYNYGRLLHHIGLFGMAATHYEKVLAMEGKLKREAAWNLSLIYTLSGSSHLSSDLFKEHLVVE